MSVELLNAKEFLAWIHTKSHLNSLAPNAAKRFVKRGQVYWCHFGLNIGSEMSKSTPRPAVVVSNFSINKNSSNIVVVPVTHNQNKLPYLVPISPVTDTEGNVILDGQADTADIICVSKARLSELITTLSKAQMREIDKSISISLDLMHYHKDETEKYNKLNQYVSQVKTDRNTAQDTLEALREVISCSGFDENGQKKIRELLDI